MNFETSKSLGGVGAILLFISPLTGMVTGFSTGIVGLIGFILLLIGAYGLAQYYREAGIFNNILYGTIVGIAGGVVSVFVAVWAAISMLPDFIDKIYPGWDGDWASLANLTPDTSRITPEDVIPFMGVFLAVIVILFIIAIIVALFYRKSLKQLSAKSGVGLFGTTGTLLLVGAVLVIAFGLGMLLIWIAALLLAIAFFQMRAAPPPDMYAQSTDPDQM
ncbi:MAG: DUF996 domain-containing protein [Candidatus Bathyarchaeota archaeon]|nr:DUF996 domain-containing protein [Candidatus Bathyarchaeota archaeon]